MLTKICSKYNNYFKGFTLIELLICLSILSIVCLFSLPFLSSFYQHNQLQVRQDEVKAAIRFAKMQSQITQESLLLVPIDNSDNWSYGMRLLVDNPQHRYIPQMRVLHEWHWDSGKIQIHWHGFQSKRYLLFSENPRNNAVNGYFLMQTNQNFVVKLIINRLGSVRIGA